MKRNLSFALILVSLLVFTYFFEERGGLQKKEKEDKESRILDFQALGNLKSFKTPAAELHSLKGELYTTEKPYPTDPELIAKLFEIFSQIKIKRIFTEPERATLKESDFFPDSQLNFSFGLERGEVHLVLGRKLLADNTFYLKLRRSDKEGELWVLAYDDTPVEGVYTQEEDRLAMGKYQRLLNIIALKEDYFWDKHPLKHLGEVKKIRVENTRNRPFEVFPYEEKTSPEVLKGLSFFKEGANFYLQEISKLKAKSIILDAPLAKLKEPLATVSFEMKDGQLVTLKLFKKFAKDSGYYVVNSLEKTLFEMEAGAAPFFYAHIQNFWDKSLAKRITPKFTLDFGNEVLENPPAHQASVQKLFSFLNVQADQVLELEENEFPLQPRLRLLFEKSTLLFQTTETELIVYDREFRLKYIYQTGAPYPFPFDSVDYSK